MGRMPRLVERGKKDRRLGEPREVSWEEIEALELDPRVELIRQLIPLGLAEVGRMLEEEVEQLAGQRHARKTEDDRHYRHGHNPGSVRLGGQRHPVRVPRVRGPAGESRLAAYEQLHGSPGEMDEGLFRKVLLGISCRDYEAAVEAVPGAIGLSKSTVKLTRFRGHIQTAGTEVSTHVEEEGSYTVRAGVPAADGRAGPGGAHAGRAGARVRAHSEHDPEMGRAAGPGRGIARGWANERGAD